MRDLCWDTGAEVAVAASNIWTCTYKYECIPRTRLGANLCRSTPRSTRHASMLTGRVNKQIRSYVIIPSRQARTHVSICHRNVRRRPAGARRIELPMHMHIMANPAGRVSERRAGRLHTPQKTSEQTHSRECIIRRIVRTRPAHARQRAPVRRTDSAEQTALSSAAATQSDRYLLFAHYIIQTARTHARTHG